MAVRVLWMALLVGLAAIAPAAAADRALLIGIDDYQDNRLDLAGAGKRDVETMAGVVEAHYGIGKEGVQTLIDADATRSAILKAIDSWLVEGTAPGDQALLYFAGHGYFSEDDSGDEADGLDEAIIPADVVVTGMHVLGLVTDDELTALVGKLRARKVTVILDTGHSGRVTREKLKTRAIAVESQGAVAARTPDLESLTRSIVVEPSAQRQKAEITAGATLIESAPAGTELTVWSAVSPSQTALVDAKAGHGVFTDLFAKGVAGAADRNGNGTVSNAELLAFVTDGAAKFCTGNATSCEMGLVPMLEPNEALAGAPKSAPAAGDTLTAEEVTDLLAKGNAEGVALEQVPPSPLKAGARNIRYRLTSPVDGKLLLLDLADDGRLTQLFPNQFTRKRDGAGSGLVKAGVPVTIPDAYYGISFDATEPGEGTIVAIVVPAGAKLEGGVATRQIEIIPKAEAKAVLLAAAAAANAPEDASALSNTRAPASAVVTLRYQILP